MGFKEFVDKITDVSRNEVKAVQKLFKVMDRIVGYAEKKESGQLSEKDFSDRHRWGIEDMASPLWDLLNYEVTYETFEKYLSEEKYLSLLKEAYEVNKEFLSGATNMLRLRDRPAGSKREARNDLKDGIKFLKKRDPLVVKMFIAKQANEFHESVVYNCRDWLINDFDAIIDIIEPVRQEYIISRKGEVKPEEVDAMLLEKFPEEPYDYEAYCNWIISRPNMAFSYYPDLKI